ncbi:MAG: tRNA (adenosine(37)-N6)-threonylcarbamoyltransferase complex dimerization subunit type 1 TsaB [Chromatiales bacterium]|nr:tRNA (adenosine(37)-N6)-threonylcarbamoyltransferase complex dimerization subunit type 1 TsaB [Chromatiales bacterium]MDP6150069.1 tRNA (adenosine(37)-N6)-threonylcarbamoyltransferase complex dimerization subunit type 1 TsaB [Gammaproteobacteria bacterium]MDP7094148.1 tRNA (adenosine(37)-N6)-threonylcarbamoyltransferase complex dimerization subunit type 1 TsaB [Gammaproteobacteria bacterium]MDP7270619.1 tRNA (adenosine(37)-N6)-threonylcarbamoyltransferase complex dimerization subunit type 1 T
MNEAFRCLAIETATSQGSVAVCDGAEQMQRTFSDKQGSSRLIYHQIASLLAEAGLGAGDLDCIAFGCGPGSFTGVRVATSVAQALAYAQDLPVCRVSSLAAIAAGAAPAAGGRPVASCLDARMGEAYMGIYKTGMPGLPTLLQADQLVDPADFLLLQSEGNFIAAGPGWDAWPDMLERNRSLIDEVLPDTWPSATSVLAIAGNQYRAGEYVQAMDALPNYVRENVTQ